MHYTCSNKEYVNMHFAYGFCIGNGRAAVAEYRQLCRIAICKTFAYVCISLRDTGSFPWSNAWCEKQGRVEADVLVAVYNSPSTRTRRISVAVWCHRRRNVECFTMMASVKEYKSVHCTICEWQQSRLQILLDVFCTYKAYFTRENPSIGCRFQKSIFGWCEVRPVRQ